MTALDSSQWMYNPSTSFYSHTIDQSLRFEDGDDAYLALTFGTPTNNKKWTYSVWMKRGNLGTNQAIMSADYDGSNYWDIRFNTSDQIYIQNRIGASNLLLANTTAVFRDVSAWYNIVFVFDSDNSTASNRAILYVNGVSQTLSASPSSGDASGYNVSGEPHHIGVSRTLSSSGGIWSEFDGYQAEINFIDGQALSATSFGETKAGIWIPKDTSGLTFGNNGFRLKFQDSSALGDDTSGNGNDFSSNGLAATDVVLDSPTNNWATMNSSDGNGPTISEGNLKVFGDTSSSVFEGFKGTFPMSSGKWYWEVNAADMNTIMQIGITPTIATAVGSSTSLSYHTDAMVYNNDGTKAIGTGGLGTSPSSKTTTSYGASYTDGDIIGVALDLDSSTTTLTFYKNNSSQGTAFSSLASDEYVALYTGISNSFGIFNFGQDSSFAGTKTAQGNTDANGNGDFFYTPPSGHLACCSASLPDPAIDPAQDEEPADYFNTVLYTGNGSSRSITGVGFSPDWIWFKARSAAIGHLVYDSVRGATKYLQTASTSAEGTGADSQTSFDSDGFSLGADTSTTGVNQNSTTYVAWNWLAGGSAVSNADGDVTSSVSANTEAGFSIVSWTQRSSSFNNNEVGHGLNKAPELIIAKTRAPNSGTWGWHVFAEPLGVSKYLFLNATNAATTSSNIWNPVNDTVFNASRFLMEHSSSAIAYCFHSVDGYSKFGSYTGNGSTDGAFVYTGFRPAWLMIKSYDQTRNWTIFDNKRTPFNLIDGHLHANASVSEQTGEDEIDFLSNGFKVRNATYGETNASGGTYIYLAFAEQPFKFANAR